MPSPINLRLAIRTTLALLTLGFVPATFAAGMTLYVQSSSAALRAQPYHSASVVVTVEHGTALEVQVLTEPNDNWQKVVYRGTEGWVPRLVLDVTPPKPRFSLAELSALLGRALDLQPNSRQRKSENAVAVLGIRGIGADERARKGDVARSTSDFLSIEKIEGIKVTKEDLFQFRQALIAEAAKDGL